MEQQRISWGEVRERAHALRLKSLKAGEPGFSVRVSDLLETLPLPYDPEPLPDDATQEEILEAEREPLDFAEDVLKRHGVRTRPAPGDVARAASSSCARPTATPSKVPSVSAYWHCSPAASSARSPSSASCRSSSSACGSPGARCTDSTDGCRVSSRAGAFSAPC